MGGVRFIKWAQDPLVSFVKCDPPSILFCGGDKHYKACKDVLAPICSVFSVVVNLEWHLRLRVMLEDPTSKTLKRSLTLKGKSFLHNKREKSWLLNALYPSCEVFAYLVLRGKVCLNPQFANLSSSGMGAIGPGITSIEDMIEFTVKRMSKGSKIYSSFTHKEGLTWSWSSHLQSLFVDLVNTVSRDNVRSRSNPVEGRYNIFAPLSRCGQ